jgi:hypothetical protein
VGVPTLDETVDHSLHIRLATAPHERSRPVVFILDNAQVLSGRGVFDGIDLLLRHAGARLRLVILTRVDPALPLHRYRLNKSMTGVRLNELAFTPVEARVVLTAHDADLFEGAAIALAETARGWAASLRRSTSVRDLLRNVSSVSRLGIPTSSASSAYSTRQLAPGAAGPLGPPVPGRRTTAGADVHRRRQPVHPDRRGHTGTRLCEADEVWRSGRVRRCAGRKMIHPVLARPLIRPGLAMSTAGDESAGSVLALRLEARVGSGRRVARPRSRPCPGGVHRHPIG